MKYIFIENIVSGKPSVHTALGKIKAAFERAGNLESFELLETEYPGHATKLANEVCARHGNNAMIFVCGGDGTFSEVIQATIGKRTPVALLPMGTGNDFAKKIYGEDYKFNDILQGFGLLQGKPKFEVIQTDCLRVNGTYCANVMSLGFDTKVVKIANKISKILPFLGSFSYKLAIVFALFGKINSKVKIALKNGGDAFEIEREYTLSAFCNGSYYGGGYTPAKNSLINDGVIDVCIAGPVSVLQIAKLAGEYAKGEAELKYPNLVKMYKATSGTIYPVGEKFIEGNCDGNPFKAEKVEFTILPEILPLACYPNQALSKALKEKEELTV